MAIYRTERIAYATIDNGETETAACYEQYDGSWLVLEYSPMQGSDNDRLSLYTYHNGKLTPQSPFSIPIEVGGKSISEHNLYFPYQGNPITFLEGQWLFPTEGGNTIVYTWDGEKFIVGNSL